MLKFYSIGINRKSLYRLSLGKIRSHKKLPTTEPKYEDFLKLLNQYHSNNQLILIEKSEKFGHQQKFGSVQQVEKETVILSEEKN